MTTATPMTLNDMRQFEGTLFVRNNTRATVTCPSKNEHIIMNPGEVRVLPKDCLDVPGFQSMVMRGKVTVGPDLADEGIASPEAHRAAQEARRVELDGILEESAERKDLLKRECLVCKKPVFQSLRQIRDMEPPLDAEHAHLSHQFVPEQTGSDAEGSPIVKFNRVQFG